MRLLATVALPDNAEVARRLVQVLLAKLRDK